MHVLVDGTYVDIGDNKHQYHRSICLQQISTFKLTAIKKSNPNFESTLYF